MSEINHTDKGILAKLFKHLDVLLAIDKSIDFILIFVGLAAALALENYIAQNALQQNYVETFARIHTEIALNKPRCSQPAERKPLGWFSDGSLPQELNQLCSLVCLQQLTLRDTIYHNNMLVYCQFIWDLIPWWGWGLLTLIHLVIMAWFEENKVLQAICPLNFYLLWFGFALPVWGDNEGGVIFGLGTVCGMVGLLLGLNRLFETEEITTPKQYVRAYGKCYECKKEVDKFIRKCPYCQTEY